MKKIELRKFKKYFSENWPALLLILLISFFWGYKNKNILTTHTKVGEAGHKYSISQYIMGDASPEPIKDSTLYTYAASRYVAGEDPTKINFEHPPLGKYILGISWKLFHNMTVINFCFYIGSLWLFWNLTKIIIKNFKFRLLGLGLLGSISLIPHYTFQSMLDILLLFSTLLFFNGLFLVKNKNWRVLITGLALGSYMSIKYFFPSIFLFGLILLIVSYKEKNIIFLIKTLTLALGTYLLSYARYFWLNPNPIDFIKFEWFRFRWWTGERTIPKFLLIDTIFTGKFKGWWAENQYEFATSWSKLWPISFLGWLLSFFILSKKFEAKILALFSATMFLLYIFGSASNERYLIQLLPFWVMFSLILLERGLKGINFFILKHTA
jgi:hypothetical protein